MTKGYFLTTVINQALPFFLLPILTRYLSTAEYGSLSLFSFYHCILFALVGASLPTVVAKHFYENDKEFIAKVIGNGIYFSLSITICVEIFILLFWTWLKDILSLPLIWILILPLAAFANVIFSYGLTICRCRRLVLHFGLHQIGNTLINALVSLLLVCVFVWGWVGRATGMVSAYFISAGIILVYLKKQGYLKLAFINDFFQYNRRFVTPLIPNSLQLVLISQVGLFFMQYYYTKELLGLYSLGFQLAFCVKLLVDTLVMSWSPFLFEQLAKNEAMDKSYVAKLLYLLIGGLFIGSVIIICLAKPVLWLMTTPAFYGANQFVIWFVIGMFFYGVYCFVQPILIKNNQQAYIGSISFLSMLIMFALNIFLPKLFGYMGIVYAYCGTYIILSLTLIVRAFRISRLPFLSVVTLTKN